MKEPPYQPFYKPYGMSDEQYAYECELAKQKLAEWEQEQMEDEMNEKLREKCWYNDCINEIREEDKSLKKETAKLCEKHNREFIKLTDRKVGEELILFMLKCTNKEVGNEPNNQR
jgi:DNA gyrase/topoisomerase IV subunit A